MIFAPSHTAVDLVPPFTHLHEAGFVCRSGLFLYGKQTLWMRCLMFLELSLFDILIFRDMKCPGTV